MTSSDVTLSWLSRRRCLLAVFACSVFVVMARAHFFDWTASRDVTTYAVAAHEMLRGKVLYLDVWDHKPPGVHLTFALFEWFLGYGRAQLFGLSVVASLATMFAIVRAGSAASFGAGIWGAILWSCLFFSDKFEATDPNVEAFLNATLAWAFALLVKPLSSRWNCLNPVLSGLLFWLACIYKPIAVVPAAALVVLAYCYRSPTNPGPRPSGERHGRPSWRPGQPLRCWRTSG